MKEILIGFGAAVLIFLGSMGFNILPIVFLIVLSIAMLFMMERRTTVTSGTKNTAVKHAVDFTQIGGQDHAKRELMEALDFLKHREKIQVLGIRPLKGILLTGPPGTGKTLMAKAAATYTDSAFVSASGSEFVEMYVGVGAQRVRELFKRARQQAKKENKDSAIVFIDEIDVVGGRRGAQSHQEYDQTLNQLLTEMDGMQTTQSPFVLVVAATNRVDILDSALLRPGRFDRIIKVDLPDREGRLHILTIQTRNKPIAGDVDLEHVARETYGFSGAQLESLTNEAAIMALREEKEKLEQGHFRDAVDKVLMGEKTGRIPNREELMRVAIHELGHAIISELVRPGSVSHITIAPRGNALGFVRQIPEKDSYLYTLDQLNNQIKVALGGTTAEHFLYGNRSTGAQNDFQQASNLARTEVTCGLSRIGIVDEESLQKSILDEEVRFILAEQEKETKALLEPFTNAIRELANAIVQDENMSGDEFRTWLSQQLEQSKTNFPVLDSEIELNPVFTQQSVEQPAAETNAAS